MSGAPRQPRQPEGADDGDVEFDDWDSAIDEWDAHFEEAVEPEAVHARPPAPASPVRAAPGVGELLAAPPIEPEPAIDEPTAVITPEAIEAGLGGMPDEEPTGLDLAALLDPDPQRTVGEPEAPALPADAAPLEAVGGILDGLLVAAAPGEGSNGREALGALFPEGEAVADAGNEPIDVDDGLPEPLAEPPWVAVDLPTAGIASLPLPSMDALELAPAVPPASARPDPDFEIDGFDGDDVEHMVGAGAFAGFETSAPAESGGDAAIEAEAEREAEALLATMAVDDEGVFDPPAAPREEPDESVPRSAGASEPAPAPPRDSAPSDDSSSDLLRFLSVPSLPSESEGTSGLEETAPAMDPSAAVPEASPATAAAADDNGEAPVRVEAATSAVDVTPVAASLPASLVVEELVAEVDADWFGGGESTGLSDGRDPFEDDAMFLAPEGIGEPPPESRAPLRVRLTPETSSDFQDGAPAVVAVPVPAPPLDEGLAGLEASLAVEIRAEPAREAPPPLPRVPTEAPRPTLSVRAPAGAVGDRLVDDDALDLLLEERAACDDPVRRSGLSCCLARRALARGDLALARARFEEALRDDEANREALGALRRLALEERDARQATELLKRERALSVGPRRDVVAALLADLLLSSGRTAEARDLYQELLGGSLDLWGRTGLADAAAAGAGDPASSLAALSEVVDDPSLRAALDAERLELAGDPVARPSGAVLHLVEAWRSRAEDREIAPLARLMTALPGRLGSAIRRRLALRRLAAGGHEGTSGATELLGDADDAPSLALRLHLEEARGDDAAARVTLERLAAQSEGVTRCEWLVSLATRAEAGGDDESARRYCQEALAAAPGDLRAVLIAERLGAAAGRPQPGGPVTDGPLESRARARSHVEAGRRGEAIAVLSDVTLDRPASVPALVELSDLLVADGRFAEAGATVESLAAFQAAAALQRGASRSLAADLLLERAGRLYARAGDAARAAGVLRPLLGGPLAASARRRLARLLFHHPTVAQPGELGTLLAAEAAPRGDAEAALAAVRLAALSGADTASAAALLRPVAQLHPDEEAVLVALELAGDRLGAASVRRDHLSALSGARALHSSWRAALAFDALGEPGSATALVDKARSLAAEATPLVEARMLERCRQLGDLDGEVSLLAARVDEGDDQDRIVGRLRLAERALRRGDLDGAVTRLRQALDLDPGSVLARSALERTLEGAGRYEDLVVLLGAELEQAADPRRRAALLERLAHLHADRLGEADTAQALFESVLEIDHDNHAAFRALERRYIAAGRDAQQITLFAQMGLTATDPRLGVAVSLERARLRRGLGGSADDLEQDLRQAVFKDGRCRPALRQLLALATDGGRTASVADTCERLAGDPDLPDSSAAVFLWRAADAYLSLGRDVEAQRCLRASLRRGGDQVPGLRALLQLALSHGDLAEALDVARRAIGAVRDRRGALESALVAGLLAEQREDPVQALAAWRAALAIAPGQPEAFERVLVALEASGDDLGRAEVLAARAAAEPDPSRAAEDHVELALLHRDRLGDLDETARHLESALALDPGHPAALAALADLHLRREAWPQAAEALILCARVEGDPATLRDVFLHLGLLYSQHLPDARRAIASFERVLELEADQRLALEQLALLYEREADVPAALHALERLGELESDTEARIGLLLRGARLQETQPGTDRASLELLRRALGFDPSRVATSIAIADYFERRGDLTSARVQLDSTSQLLRQKIARDPSGPEPYHGLFRIAEHRRAVDAAWLIASVADCLGAATDDEATLLARQGGREQPVRAALASHAVDELLFDAAVPPGFRSLLARLDEPLGKLLRGDLKRFGVGRADRVPKVHLVREVGLQVSADLGLRDLDLFVSRAQPGLIAVELTDPVSIVFGERVLAGASQAELRFLFARLLKLVQAGLGAAVRAGPDELGLMAGGLIRQFVPDYTPLGFDPKLVAQETARLARVVPRKLHQELLPYAMECSAPDLDWRAVWRQLHLAGDRAGLLAAGSVQAAVAALRRLGDPDAVNDLLRFAVSDDLSELRLLAGVALS